MSIIFLLLLLFGLFYLVNKFRINKFGYWVLGGYVVILLAFVVVYLFIPRDALYKAEELEEDSTWVGIVHQVAYEDRSIDDYKQYKQGDWVFAHNLEQPLHVLMNSDLSDFLILVKEIKGQENIHATHYQVKPVLEFEKDVHVLEHIDLDYRENEVWVTLPSPLIIEFAALEKDFYFNLFNEGESRSYPHLDLYGGEHVLYLEVPEGLEIIFDSSIYYEYID